MGKHVFVREKAKEMPSALEYSEVCEAWFLEELIFKPLTCLWEKKSPCGH